MTGEGLVLFQLCPTAEIHCDVVHVKSHSAMKKQPKMQYINGSCCSKNTHQGTANQMANKLIIKADNNKGESN